MIVSVGVTKGEPSQVALVASNCHLSALVAGIRERSGRRGVVVFMVMDVNC